MSVVVGLLSLVDGVVFASREYKRGVMCKTTYQLQDYSCIKNVRCRTLGYVGDARVL